MHAAQETLIGQLNPPILDGPITVGIDSGSVRDWHEKKSHFEVIVGKSILAFRRADEANIPSSKCLGFVQTLDPKPKQRLFEVLQLQGHQLNQQIAFLSDGGDTVRDLQLYPNPHAEHLLDWFYLAMRLTGLRQTAKGLPDTTRDDEEAYLLRDPVVQGLERLKWYLWHGKVYKALQVIQSIEMDLDAAVATSGHATERKLLKAMEEFHTCVVVPGFAARRAASRGLTPRFLMADCPHQGQSFLSGGERMHPARPDCGGYRGTLSRPPG